MYRMLIALMFSAALPCAAFGDDPEGLFPRTGNDSPSNQTSLKIVRDDCPDEWKRKTGMLAYEGGEDKHGFPIYGFVSYSNPEEILTPAIYYDYSIYKKSYLDGLICVCANDDIGRDFWGFINFQGQEVIPCKYKIGLAGEYDLQDHLFDNGMVVMSIDYKIYGAFDKSGNIAIPFEYDDIQPFYDGIMTLCKNGLYAAVDKNMEVLIPYRYTKLYYFGNNRYVAARDGKYGVIDGTENILIPFEFKWISADWRRGWAYAELPDGTTVAIDPKGKIIPEP